MDTFTIPTNRSSKNIASKPKVKSKNIYNFHCIGPMGWFSLQITMSVFHTNFVNVLSKLSSDSRESLNHRDPFRFLESWYQSRYQDCNSKSLDSSLNIKTQDLRVLIPVLMSKLKFHKSLFQSWYQDWSFKSFHVWI